MSTTGAVFDVSRGCVDDGPGLRTVVFLQGCALDCPWCHNPEGKRRIQRVAFDGARCIGCRSCLEACRREWAFDPARPDAWRDGCTTCGACVEACPSSARRLVSRDVGVDELVQELLEDRDYFDGTGGGVTFSGGDPVLQAEFVFACAAALRDAGVHVAVETAGLWPTRLVPRLAEAVDLVIFDLKHCDPEKLGRTMGTPCLDLLGNLSALLASQRVELELRLTLVPGFNDAPADLDTIVEWLLRQPRDHLPPLQLRRYHRMATAKARLYGLDYPFAEVPPLPPGALDSAAALLEARGVPVTRG